MSLFGDERNVKIWQPLLAKFKQNYNKGSCCDFNFINITPINLSADIGVMNAFIIEEYQK